MATKTYKAEDLIQALRVKFSDTQRYALFEQVGNETGYGASSWIDAILVYLWPSDGLIRSAFEVKVSRQDFLKELQNPQKNEWARQVCNEFWFIAPKDVIKEQELPEGVGWMRPHGGKLAIVRHAQRTEAEMGPEFVAAIARAIQKQQRREKKDLRRKVLEESEEYRQAKRMADELEVFVNKNGQDGYYQLHKEGGVERVLSKIVNGAQVEKEIRHIRKALSRFQGNIVGLFNDFLVLAYASMVECDDLGNFVMAEYGNQDEGVLTITEQRALLKKSKRERSYHYEDNAKKIVGAFARMGRLLEEQDENVEG